MLIKTLMFLALISTLHSALTEDQLIAIEGKLDPYPFTVFRKADGLYYFRNPGKDPILVDMKCNQSLEKKFVYLPLKTQGIFIVYSQMKNKADNLNLFLAFRDTYKEGTGSHSNLQSVIQKIIISTGILDLNKVVSNLLPNEYAAGEVCIEKGIVKWFTNQSGTFMHSVEETGFSSFMNYIKNGDTDYHDYTYGPSLKIFFKEKHLKDFPNYPFLPELKETLTFKDDDKTPINLNCNSKPGIYLYIPARKEFADFPPLFFIKGVQGKAKPNIFLDMLLRKTFISAHYMIPYVQSINPLLSKFYSFAPNDYVIGGICVSNGKAQYITNYVEELDMFMDPETVEVIAKKLGITKKYVLPLNIPVGKRNNLHIWGEISAQELKILLDLKDLI